MRVLIGNAWPYANGRLHLGRMVCFIPGDILARYHRKKGDEVVFVSGSDAHGNLILEKAKEEKIEPLKVVEKYHNELERTFDDLEFSFNIFSNTEKEYHKKFVKEKFLSLYKKGYIYKSKENNEETLIFSLSKFSKEIKKIFDEGDFWRENAKKITSKYIDEGIRDRAVIKDIDFGVEVPISGYENKKIFVWIEALMGYLTATSEIVGEENLKKYLNRESRVYLVHGKDNIPFHTIVFTGILAALGYKDVNIREFSSNHLKLEGKNFSTIKNWALWIDDLLESYSVDLIRYFLILNGPEEKDTDFKWKNFINTNNNDLVDGIERFKRNTIGSYEKGKCKVYRNKYEKDEIIEVYNLVGTLIEEGKFKDGLLNIIKLIKKSNEDRSYSLIKLINIGNLLEPFMPSEGKKIKELFNVKETKWGFIELDECRWEFTYKEEFRYIDKSRIIEEINKLKKKRQK